MIDAKTNRLVIPLFRVGQGSFDLAAALKSCYQVLAAQGR